MCSHRPTPHTWRAFTLIELLVVVAIVVLLMSILLPALRGAREEAKCLKCLANLKEIGRAMTMYFQDQNDWFPHARSNGDAITGVYYGGHPGRPADGNNPGANWIYETQYRTTPNGRPLNRYLYANLPNYDITPENPDFEIVRQVPVFFCPSDSGGFWNSDGYDDPFVRPMHHGWGTSYDSNYHFLLNWASRWYGWRHESRWNQLANAYSKIQLQRYASNFIILYEDPFDSAQWLHIPRVGWHRKFNRHNVLFLDSHAAEMYLDTTTNHATSGPGWKTGSGNSHGDPHAWWNNSDDPDYSLRLMSPLSGT